MRTLLPLGLILGFGCTNFAMRAEHTIAELDRLPGRSDPVRAVCRDQSGGAVGRLPIQLRPDTGPGATEAAFVDCMDVLSVFVSVAMENGDTTDDGLGTVRKGLAGLDSESLTDACEEHYPAWQALWVQEGRFRSLDAAAVDDESLARYDFWMRRCRRVLRPVAAAETAGP
ncbi:MAG: hypothetical protein OXI45_12270 [Acidobacteriota bacterium]|nr:hypothetical protein [Acidobacteriota bacterium]MDE2711807.1 hypothetical protein [Acidobacteriota bacterium]MXW72034.1 hypothetical protein [Acidobacteriota bacterium]MYE42897.1 hypothetical protein [Acidobacteriota bacterium]